MSNDKLNDVILQLHEQKGRRNAIIELYGDKIAKREGYQEHVGIDAIHFYLVYKYKWLPSTVKALSFDDIDFLLTEEMMGWTGHKDDAEAADDDDDL